MDDIEQRILHYANNFFFIRVVALDWTEGFGQYAINGSWHIEQMWSLKLDQASMASSALASDDLKVQVHHRCTLHLQWED